MVMQDNNDKICFLTKLLNDTKFNARSLQKNITKVVNL